MRINNDVLAEYEKKSDNTSKFYKVIIITATLFILFLFTDMFVDIETMRWTGFTSDFTGILLVTLIPVVSLLLFIFKTRVGWIMLTFFSTFILTAGLFSMIDSEDIGRELKELKGRHSFILAITATLTILLQTRRIRLRNKINSFIWIIVVIISSLLAILSIIYL